MVGSNSYLTPLNSQGFAPHYDDVDVFILQLEGFKRWRVYPPINKKETLPRASSRDYTEKEIEEMGEEEIDMVLGPGDVLYLPRGWIHQAETVARPGHLPKVTGVKDDHSLHLTLSAMQNWSWADFLEMLIPEALEGAAASEKSTSLREGLPVNFLSYMGTMHGLEEEDESDLPEGLRQAVESQKVNETVRIQSNDGGESGEECSNDEDDEAEMLAKQARIRALQNAFKEEAKKRIMRVCKQAMSMLDDACDQIGIRFLSDRLPPAFLKPEAALTKEAHASSSTSPHHHDASKKIWPNTLCRLVRPNIARLVIEDSKAVLYHCLDNSLVYHKTPLSPMEFEVDDAPALEQLLTTVEPNWIMVKDLLHGDVEDKMEIAQALYDEGILATKLLESPDRSVQTG
jgi:lysine-specific demethylase/histidyl-hydroxylase NO66